jgi:hypothetical protein
MMKLAGGMAEIDQFLNTKDKNKIKESIKEGPIFRDLIKIITRCNATNLRWR